VVMTSKEVWENDTIVVNRARIRIRCLITGLFFGEEGKVDIIIVANIIESFLIECLLYIIMLQITDDGSRKLIAGEPIICCRSIFDAF
jgi:hypothetical protein